jgi:hypothetical protein
MACFRGKWQVDAARDAIERNLEGHICSDNAVGAHKPSHFLRLRTLLVGGILRSSSLYFALRAILQMFKMVPYHFVWLFFFAVDHIYRINMEQL